ncbi:MAG: hypothetical protein HLX48_15005, partial [Halomonas sp.]|nr:hypothetical protein [Halomonas sp.]
MAGTTTEEKPIETRSVLGMHLAKTLVGLALGLALTTPLAASPVPDGWQAIREQARGQTVYWNAWAGD